MSVYESGYTVKYNLVPHKIPWTPPLGFPQRSFYISPYIPTQTFNTDTLNHIEVN